MVEDHSHNVHAVVVVGIHDKAVLQAVLVAEVAVGPEAVFEDLDPVATDLNLHFYIFTLRY